MAGVVDDNFAFSRVSQGRFLDIDRYDRPIGQWLMDVNGRPGDSLDITVP